MSLTERLCMGGVIAGALAGSIIGGPSASAATVDGLPETNAATIVYDVHTTEVHGCYAALDAEIYRGRLYVRARFHSRTVSCFGSHLERKKSSGPYRQISFTYTESPGQWRYTGWHLDPAPYKARACTSSDTLVRACTVSF